MGLFQAQPVITIDAATSADQQPIVDSDRVSAPAVQSPVVSVQRTRILASGVALLCLVILFLLVALLGRSP